MQVAAPDPDPLVKSNVLGIQFSIPTGAPPVVDEVVQGGVADNNGATTGQFLVSINGEPVKPTINSKELEDILAAASTLDLFDESNGQIFTVSTILPRTLPQQISIEPEQLNPVPQLLALPQQISTEPEQQKPGPPLLALSKHSEDLLYEILYIKGDSFPDDHSIFSPFRVIEMFRTVLLSRNDGSEVLICITQLLGAFQELALKYESGVDGNLYVVVKFKGDDRSFIIRPRKSVDTENYQEFEIDYSSITNTSQLGEFLTYLIKNVCNSVEQTLSRKRRIVQGKEVSDLDDDKKISDKLKSFCRFFEQGIFPIMEDMAEIKTKEGGKKFIQDIDLVGVAKDYSFKLNRWKGGSRTKRHKKHRGKKRSNKKRSNKKRSNKKRSISRRR
jgi:hypothetical protein